MVNEGDLRFGGGGLLLLDRVLDLGDLLRERVVRNFPRGDRLRGRGEGERLCRGRDGGEGDLCRAGGDGDTLPLDTTCHTVFLFLYRFKVIKTKLYLFNKKTI